MVTSDGSKRVLCLNSPCIELNRYPLFLFRSRVTKSAPWGERSYHILVTGSDGCLILMGGQTFSKTYNDVWKSCDGESWQQVTANAPWQARAGLAATVHNGTIVVAGGCYNIPNSGTPPKRGFFNDVWRSDDNGQTWQVATKAAPWSGRSGPRLVSFKDQLFLVAGERGFTPDVQLKEVWSSPDGGASWTLVNKTPAFSARSGHGLVVTPSKSHMLLLAGTCACIHSPLALALTPHPSPFTLAM